MLLTKNYLNKDLVDIFDIQGGQEEYFAAVYQKLNQLDYIEDGYLGAIVEREKAYPTGLETPFLSVAIPHTDPQYIKKPFIYMVKLEKPIVFGQMGTTDTEIQVTVTFVLGVEKGDDQLVVLQSLMKMFADERVMTQLKEVKEVTGFYQIVCDFFNNTIKE
ncbi:PTS sugar transporter subunit IIA [Vagococcus sp. BWB3-3]|uniref:PTS sugar transporter subunit IIA n=1 Tax=Vagococcus allomyrinae TaxID=2794353 RepID=A0A940SX73_9ENTE|nr:PTS sugar transporter subunit IIA [Vagococcus allomyrinae]MBP1043784.1 PTS sugar transporter subunit IIA [Vagococcus allomyrinae]